ncbi:MAG: hypothetical protein JNL92_08705, partial [Opitutaceae bacterium]|nr:hypothetical protein [Opitutaceae bacterium]
MRASLPAPSRRRRRLLPALAGFVVALVVCLTVPLPIGWLINLGGAAFFPVDSRLRVHVGGATFRWALGGDRVRMEFEQMDTTVQGRPLAKFDRTVVEFDKAALWRGLVRPRRIFVRGASAVIDFTAGGALRILMSERTDPAASVAPAELLVLMAPLLPKVGEQSELVLERLGVECIVGTERWRIAGGSRLLVSHDPAGPLRIKGATSLGGDGREPVPATLEAAIVPAEARAHFSLAIPEFQLRRLHPRDVPDEAVPGTMALSVSGSVDLANGDVQAGQIAWSVQDARIPIVPDAPALPLERMVVHGKLERRGTELHGALERGELRLAGAAVQVRKLEVALMSQLRVDWETDVQGVAGTSLLPYFPAELLTKASWLGPLLRASAVSEVRSTGQAAFLRQGLIASEVHELRFRQALSLAVAGETLRAEITAEKAAGAPLRATVQVPPFVVRRLAPALPAAWRLQQMDVPVQLDAHAHLTGDGRLIDAEARVAAAAGR